ncbi:hypothetical protein FIBSPDRAFT_960932 [Athelia psychrophila]|uniref:Uncharacterized protein n=1 Tax=Athelia psychrophila TaxID=1759441 RepID=A0A166BUL9_9AGAM|nr:hypothetical protein FIBSPDRAFT_960932 [Fibularhizoctonia sp. CBS 109695]
MSGISNTLSSTAANEEEDWSQLNAWDRCCRKKAKIEKERDAEELAELVNQAGPGQQLADEVKAAEGGATQQGAGGTIGTAANEEDDWSHLTPSERYSKKNAKIWQEYRDEECAELAAERGAGS